MGRPSKLTDRQWGEIRKRLLAGEKASALSKEYGVSNANISARFSEKIAEIKAVAKRVITAENELKTVQSEIMAMPISERIATLTMADDMRTISTHLSGAARYGAATAHRLMGIANGQVDQIDDANPMESQEVLQAISALTKISNESAKTGIDLINASKRDPLPDTSEANKITGFRVVAR
jgi:hypothetical protein